MKKIKRIVATILCISLVATSAQPLFALENYNTNNETTFGQSQNEETTKDVVETVEKETETTETFETKDWKNFDEENETTYPSEEDAETKESTKYAEEAENEKETAIEESLELETFEEVDLEKKDLDLSESKTESEIESENIKSESESVEGNLLDEEILLTISTASYIEYNEELEEEASPLISTHYCLAATMSFVDYLELTTIEQFNANEEGSATQNGNTITLEKDIQLVYPIYISDELNIDLNNHKINAAYEYSAFNITNDVKFFDDEKGENSIIQGTNVRTIYVKNANVVVDGVNIYAGKGNDKTDTVGNTGPDAFYLDYDSNDYTFTFLFGKIIGGTGGSGSGDMKGNFGAPLKIGEFDTSNYYMLYGKYGQEGGGDGGNAIYCTYEDVEINNFIIENDGIVGGDGGENINPKPVLFNTQAQQTTNETSSYFLSNENWGREVITSFKNQGNTSLCEIYSNTATIETSLLVSTPGFIKSLGYSDGSKDDKNPEFNLSEFHLGYYFRQPQEDVRGNAKQYKHKYADNFYDYGTWGKYVMNQYVCHNAQAEEELYPLDSGKSNPTGKKDFVELKNKVREAEEEEEGDKNRYNVKFYVDQGLNKEGNLFKNGDEYINEIKKLVSTYGACEFSLYVRYYDEYGNKIRFNKTDAYHNKLGDVIYYAAEFDHIPETGGHAMCCVGWDDNFNSNGEYGNHKGALIVKNSWSEQKYYLFSYDYIRAVPVGEYETTAYIVKPNEKKLKNVNYYDSNNFGEFINASVGKKIAHVYKAQEEKEKIYKVGFTSITKMKAKIRVYQLGKNPLNMKNVNEDDAVWESEELTFDGGYKSIDIPKGIEVDKDNFYGVEVEITGNVDNMQPRLNVFQDGAKSDKKTNRYAFYKNPNSAYTKTSTAYRIKAITNSAYSAEFDCYGGGVVDGEDEEYEYISTKFKSAIYYAEPFGNTSTKVPERAGYVFAGWEYSKDKGKTYEDIDASTILEPTEDDVFCFRAKWTQGIATYSVTLDARGGKMSCYEKESKKFIEVDIATYSYASGTPFGEKSIPKKENAIFKGWYTTYYNEASPSEVLANTILNLHDNKMIIYAEYYDANPYKLKLTADSTHGTYVGEGGSDFEEIATNSIAKVSLKPFSEKVIPDDGYYFDYWLRDNGVEYARDAVFSDMSIAKDQTVILTAKFKEKTNNLPADWYEDDDFESVSEIEIIASKSFIPKVGSTKHEIYSSKLNYYVIPDEEDKDYVKIEIVSTNSNAKILLEDSFDNVGAFTGFKNAEDIKGLENLDTSNTKNMNFLFDGCKNLKELDLSTFDTNKLKYASGMFANCEKIEILDLSAWDTSKITNTDRMFEGCSNLKTINLCDDMKVDDIEYSEGMFDYCSKNLAGGNGTIWHDSDSEGKPDTDKTFAWCDDLDASPSVAGYFTKKQKEDIQVIFRAANCEKNNYTDIIKKGSTASEPDTPLHYDEADWYEDENFTTKWNFDTPVDSNLILYSNMEATKYNITYNLNGGTITGSPVYSYTIEDDDISLSNISAIKSGYSFIGWTDENGNTITVVETEQGGNRTINANWKSNSSSGGSSSSGGGGGGGGSISAGALINGQLVPTAAPKEQTVLTVRPSDDNIPVANVQSSIWITDPITGSLKMTFVNELGQVQQCANGFYNLVKTEYVIDPITNIPIPKVTKASYYFDAAGNMQTGWVKTLDGKTYFFDNEKTNNEGNMSIGWKQVQGSWYYFNDDGSMLTNGVTKDGQIIGADGKWVNPNATNTQMQTNGAQVNANINGALLTTSSSYATSVTNYQNALAKYQAILATIQNNIK